MELHEFYYKLPKELIAQYPLKQRDKARLLALNRDEKSIVSKTFRDIIEYLRKGDCLVLNDTRALPVRFYGNRKTGAKVELFILDTLSETLKALVRPSKKIKEGERIKLTCGIEAEVMGKADIGRFVKFTVPLDKVLRYGHVPLPPYIKRRDLPEDKNDYETVYARRDGATASPTAGLHFTRELLNKLKKKGVVITCVTLHTSYGTFAPVTERDIENHVMHSEYCEINAETADIVNKTKLSGNRVFAVGTTCTRVLEGAAISKAKVAPFEGRTTLFIYPGYDFKIIDGLITNFHVPESTLLMLVSAFAGKDFIFKAYEKAIKEKYRFFSYGDAMLIC